MALVRVTVHRRAVRQLLRGPEVQSDLLRRGRAIAAAAGAGHAVEGEVGPNRARVAVYTETFEAMRAEATERTLTRAVDAGRG